MKLKPFLRIDDQFSLHLARPELAEPIFSVVEAQREYLREWLPWVDPTQKVEDTRRFITDSMDKNAGGEALTTFILEDQEVVGSVGVIHFNRDHKLCEIGYWLRQELQGRGIMTKACRCLIDHVFRTKNMNRIEVRVATGNVRSRNVPLRLGFKHEGTLRQALYMYGEFRDIDLFSLLRTEWEAGSAK